MVTVIDIIVHDGYVLDDIADCHISNESERCIKLYETHQCDFGDQLCLGQNYWDLLVMIVQVTGFALLIGRIVIGKLAGAKTNPMLFIVGGLWYVSAVIFYYFGFLDLFYYWFRGNSIPDTPLNWLDNIGLFTIVQGFGKTSSVDATDLYLLNFIGIIIYVSLWLFFVHHHRKKSWQRLGLI